MIHLAVIGSASMPEEAEPHEVVEGEPIAGRTCPRCGGVLRRLLEKVGKRPPTPTTDIRCHECGWGESVAPTHGETSA